MAFKQSSNSFTDSVADARIEYIESFLKELDNVRLLLKPKEKGLKIA